MARPVRTTGPLLDVLGRLLRADVQGEDLHGWQIMKDTKRAGPTVYGVLDRLEDLQWITSYWEILQPDENRPRRRLYRLTDAGRAGVRDLLADRRPEELKNLTGPVQRNPGLLSPRRSIVPGSAR
jgi:PadR family transcriptional regulator, regulatory protein PadR